MLGYSEATNIKPLPGCYLGRWCTPLSLFSQPWTLRVGCSQAYLALKRHLSTSSSAYIRRHQCASLIGFESRFQRGERFGSLRGSVPGVWSSSTICGVFLLGNKSELSHNNDGTTTVRVLYYTQCIAAWRTVGYVMFKNDGTVTVRVLHYTQCIAAWRRVGFVTFKNDGTATVRVSHYTECIAAWRRVGFVTFNNDGTVTVRVLHYIQVHCGLKESRVRNF